MQIAVVKLLPTRGLTKIMSVVIHAEFPQWLMKPLLYLYIWAYGCNMKEAEVEDVQSYPSIGKLFLRKLKSNSRSIHTSAVMVSPCDSTVQQFGKLNQGCLKQIKGIDYSLETFLGADVVEQMNASLSTAKDHKLHFITFYLSPGDYHHFHSPAEWRATLRRHVPGQLLPVSPWAVKLLPGLFTVNERVVLAGDWEYGSFTYSAIGAFNVGSINVDGDKELESKCRPRFRGQYRDRRILEENSSGVVWRKGDHMGSFNLGSTVVLIFEAPERFSFTVKHKQQVKFGQCIGQLLSVNT